MEATRLAGVAASLGQWFRSPPPVYLHALVGPLDAGRLWLLRSLGPLARKLVVDRELRVAVGGCLAVGVALACTVSFPLWMLALGPLILGVPHLLSDVRYLVVEPGLHRRRELWLVCGLPILGAGCNAGIGVGLLGVAGAFYAARGPFPHRRAAIAAAVGLAGLAWWWTSRATLVFSHVHNLVAVLFWWAWRERQRRVHRLPLLAMLVAAVLLLGGAFEPWMAVRDSRAWGPRGLGLEAHLAALAPGFSPQWGVRLVLLFAFAQAIHYSVWLRLVPDEARARATPRTFRATLAVLEQELTPRGPWLVVGAAVGLGIWALFDVAGARQGYLGMALFHGYLELTVAALWWAEGTRSWARAPGPVPG